MLGSGVRKKMQPCPQEVLKHGSLRKQFTKITFKILTFRGAWVAQSAKWLTLGFGSGLDLRVLGWSPTSGSVLSIESA